MVAYLHIARLFRWFWKLYAKVIALFSGMRNTRIVLTEIISDFPRPAWTSNPGFENVGDDNWHSCPIKSPTLFEGIIFTRTHCYSCAVSIFSIVWWVRNHWSFTKCRNNPWHDFVAELLQYKVQMCWCEPCRLVNVGLVPLNTVGKFMRITAKYGFDVKDKYPK